MNFPISKKAVVPKQGPPPLPPIHKQAVNYAKANAITAARVLTGKQAARSEAEVERLVEHHCLGHGTGEVCPKYRFSDRKCAECGCPVRKRARRLGLGCPLGKFR
jgi:hypothetical protein